MLFPDQWPVRKGTVTDAAIAFITWSTTYLFVRRLFNPETVRTACLPACYSLFNLYTDLSFPVCIGADVGGD